MKTANSHETISQVIKYCSVIAHTSEEQIVLVWVSNKYVIPAAHDVLTRVSSTARPQKKYVSADRARIVSANTLDGVPQDEIWQALIVARTVTHWCNKTMSALLQIGNSSDRTITLQPKTVVGAISPVTAISPRTASAMMLNNSESSQARIDLTTALDESFKKSTFNDQQKTQLLDLCTQYRSNFSLNQEELGRCTIAEAEFPLQENTKPVDRHPYRTNPRPQEVIDKCVESMESVDIIEESPSAWGSPVCTVFKADGSPCFCVEYRNTFLVRETWPMPDIELISTQWVARNSSQSATCRALTGKYG